MPFLPRRLTAALLTTALSGMTLTLVTTSPANAAGDAVDLGSASAFAVLGSSTVTNTGSTVVTGDLGLAPGTSVTGFPPGQVVGTTHVADATAVQAQTDARAALTTANGLPGTVLGSVQLGGQQLSPGVYDGGALDLTGNLVLDAGGDPDAVFVLRASSTLTTAATSTVTLQGRASPCHVFWAVGTSATLGADSTFVGTIDAEVSVSAGARAAVSGRLLALTGAVTLIDNAVTRPVCTAAVIAPATPTVTIAPAAPTAPAPAVTAPAPAPSTPAPSATPTPSPTASASASPTATPTGTPTATSSPSTAPVAPAPTAAPTPTRAPAPRSSVQPDSLTAPDAAPQPAPQAPAQPSSPTGSDSPGGPATGLPVTGLAVREAVGLGGLALLLGGALMAAGSTPPKHRRPLLRGRRLQPSA